MGVLPKQWICLPELTENVRKRVTGALALTLSQWPSIYVQGPLYSSTIQVNEFFGRALVAAEYQEILLFCGIYSTFAISNIFQRYQQSFSNNRKLTSASASTFRIWTSPGSTIGQKITLNITSIKLLGFSLRTLFAFCRRDWDHVWR